MTKPYKREVFISYTHENKEAANELGEIIRLRNGFSFDPQVDATFIQPGWEISETVRNKIERSDVFICLATEDTLGSAWVQFELGYALGKTYPIVLIKENPPGKRKTPQRSSFDYSALYTYLLDKYPERRLPDLQFERVAAALTEIAPGLSPKHNEEQENWQVFFEHVLEAYNRLLEKYYAEVSAQPIATSFESDSRTYLEPKDNYLFIKIKADDLKKAEDLCERMYGLRGQIAHSLEAAETYSVLQVEFNQLNISRVTRTLELFSSNIKRLDRIEMNLLYERIRGDQGVNLAEKLNFLEVGRGEVKGFQWLTNEEKEKYLHQGHLLQHRFYGLIKSNGASIKSKWLGYDILTKRFIWIKAVEKHKKEDSDYEINLMRLANEIYLIHKCMKTGEGNIGNKGASYIITLKGWGGAARWSLNEPLIPSQENISYIEENQSWFVTPFYVHGSLDELMFSNRAGADIGPDVRIQEIRDLVQAMVAPETHVQEIKSDWTFIQPFFSQICEALSFLKELKIVHTDLEPSNILIRYRRESSGFSGQYIPILSDFDRAVGLEHQPSIPGFLRLRARQDTILFAPPERVGILNRIQCVSALDMYAFGVIFGGFSLEMATPGDYSPFHNQLRKKIGEPEKIANKRGERKKKYRNLLARAFRVWSGISRPRTRGLAHEIRVLIRQAIATDPGERLTAKQAQEILQNAKRLKRKWRGIYAYYLSALIGSVLLFLVLFKTEWLYDKIRYNQINSGESFELSEGYHMMKEDKLELGGKWWNLRDYVLKGGVLVVKKGQTLTICAGTTIRFDKDSWLLVQRGGKIEIKGSENEPVVFRPKDEDERWGGVVICGNAPAKFRSGEKDPSELEDELEFTPINFGGDLRLNKFGGGDSSDNSGTVQYLVIVNPGLLPYGNLPSQELNGLTLAGVGRKTKLKHIAVINSQDDGFELFGGNAKASYLYEVNSGDDGFDFDQHFQGELTDLYSFRNEINVNQPYNKGVFVLEGPGRLTDLSDSRKSWDYDLYRMDSLMERFGDTIRSCYIDRVYVDWSKIDWEAFKGKTGGQVDIFPYNWWDIYTKGHLLEGSDPNWKLFSLKKFKVYKSFESLDQNPNEGFPFERISKSPDSIPTWIKPYMPETFSEKKEE